MELSITQTNENSAEVSPSCVPSDALSTNSSPVPDLVANRTFDWVALAVKTPRKKRRLFSPAGICIWEQSKRPTAFTLTDCLEELAHPAPESIPAPAPKFDKSATLPVLAMNAWKENWANNSWAIAQGFYESTEAEQQPRQPILKIATDLGNF